MCVPSNKPMENSPIGVQSSPSSLSVVAPFFPINAEVSMPHLGNFKVAENGIDTYKIYELETAKGYEPVQIVISYAAGSAYVDGPMNVAFGDIEINAASVGAQSQGGGETPSEPQSSNVELPDYLVTAQGEITGYNGAGGAVTIPSTLPLYVESQYEYVKLDDCISMCMTYQDMNETQATGSCTQLKTDVESGKTDQASGASEVTQQFYSGAKSGGLIVQGYEATGQNVTVTSIVSNVFENKEITSVTIPSTVETIGSSAFSGNEIATLDLSNASSLTTIGVSAFQSNKLTSVTIPNSVTTIGSFAFDQNNITSVTIGSGLTTIGTSAFADGSGLSNGKNYGPNAITSVTINVACDTYKTSFTAANQFGWASGHTNDEIVWGTACTN